MCQNVSFQLSSNVCGAALQHFLRRNVSVISVSVSPAKKLRVTNASYHGANLSTHWSPYVQSLHPSLSFRVFERFTRHPSQLYKLYDRCGRPSELYEGCLRVSSKLIPPRVLASFSFSSPPLSLSLSSFPSSFSLSNIHLRLVTYVYIRPNRA